MQATRILVHEHQVISQGLAVLDALATRLAAGERVPQEDVEQLLEFFVVFADACHHLKEETILFPALEAAGLPRGQGPLGVMLEQHDQGRRRVGILRQEVPALPHDAAARGRFVAAARAYVALLEQHIAIENEVLFPEADTMLTEERDGEIAAAFDRHEALEMGPGVHEQFHRALAELAQLYL